MTQIRQMTHIQKLVDNLIKNYRFSEVKVKHALLIDIEFYNYIDILVTKLINESVCRKVKTVIDGEAWLTTWRSQYTFFYSTTKNQKQELLKELIK